MKLRNSFKENFKLEIEDVYTATLGVLILAALLLLASIYDTQK